MQNANEQRKGLLSRPRLLSNHEHYIWGYHGERRVGANDDQATQATASLDSEPGQRAWLSRQQQLLTHLEAPPLAMRLSVECRWMT